MKKAFLFLLLICSYSGIIWAEDPPPANLGKGEPERPKAPSRNRVYCYLDGSQLVIESSCEAYGLVTLTDEISGNVVFQTTAILYPELRVDLQGLSGSFTVTINIDGQDFIETIIL